MLVQRFNSEVLTRKALVLDAERYAVELAGRFPASDYKRVFVWLTDGEAFVRVAADEPEPEGARLHCVAQRWDAETVQLLRFDGERSEWVRIDEGALAWEKPIVAPQP